MSSNPKVTNDLFGSNNPTSMNSTNNPSNKKYLNGLNKSMTPSIKAPTKTTQMAEVNEVFRLSQVTKQL